VVRSVVGPGAVVEAGAEVRDSVLLGGAVVRRGARVVRAVLDDRVEVGAGANVGGDGGDLVVVGYGARVEPGARLGPGALCDARREDAGPAHG
jgi:glucose-1-phosphate adenylyltransferase